MFSLSLKSPDLWPVFTIRQEVHQGHSRCLPHQTGSFPRAGDVSFHPEKALGWGQALRGSGYSLFGLHSIASESRLSCFLRFWWDSQSQGIPPLKAGLGNMNWWWIDMREKNCCYSQVMAHPQETIHELLLLGASDLRLVALFLLQLCDPRSVLPFPFLLLSSGKVGFDQRAPTDPNIGIRKGVSGPGFRQKALRFPCMFRIGKTAVRDTQRKNSKSGYQLQGSRALWRSRSGKLNGLGHRQTSGNQEIRNTEWSGHLEWHQIMSSKTSSNLDYWFKKWNELQDLYVIWLKEPGKVTIRPLK